MFWYFKPIKKGWLLFVAIIGLIECFLSFNNSIMSIFVNDDNNDYMPIIIRLIVLSSFLLLLCITFFVYYIKQYKETKKIEKNFSDIKENKNRFKVIKPDENDLIYIEYSDNIEIRNLVKIQIWDDPKYNTVGYGYCIDKQQEDGLPGTVAIKYLFPKNNLYTSFLQNQNIWKNGIISKVLNDTDLSNIKSAFQRSGGSNNEE